MSIDPDSGSDPAAAVAALQDAIDGDEAAIEQACTIAGWMSDSRDAARSFLAQLRRKGLRLRQDGASLSHRGRAAVPVALHDRSDRARGQAWLLLFRAGPGAWVLEAATRSAAHADAFVRAQLPALLTWAGLPAAPDLHAQIAAQLDTPEPTDPAGALIIALQINDRSIQLGDAVSVAARQRGAVRLEVDEGDGPRPMYLYFERKDGAWMLTEHAWAFQRELLLGDVSE
jgi:hypothetical protein